MESTSRGSGAFALSDSRPGPSGLVRPCPGAYIAPRRAHRAPLRLSAARGGAKIEAPQGEPVANPKETSSAGPLTTLANQLLMNAASLLRSERKTAHCIPCHGSGIVECSACKGAGIVAPEKVAKMNSIKHAVHKLKAKLSADAPQFDDDWVKTNRCRRCRGTGRAVCGACGGTGRRFGG